MTTPPLVTEDNGPRPAGPPDRCFFCQQRIGQPHRPDCVLWTRKVRMRAVIEYLSDEPVSFTHDDIRFRFNESGWCADNFLAMLADLSERLGCLCSLQYGSPGGASLRFEVVGDAEEGDGS